MEFEMNILAITRPNCPLRTVSSKQLNKGRFTRLIPLKCLIIGLYFITYALRIHKCTNNHQPTHYIYLPFRFADEIQWRVFYFVEDNVGFLVNQAHPSGLWFRAFLEVQHCGQDRGITSRFGSHVGRSTM